MSDTNTAFLCRSDLFKSKSEQWQWDYQIEGVSDLKSKERNDYVT